MSAPKENRLLRSARREAMATIVVWLMAMAATLTTSYVMGYRREYADLTFIWGIPDWVFWGVLVPWVACIGVSGWFAFWFVEDVPLGDEQAEREVSSETAD